MPTGTFLHNNHLRKLLASLPGDGLSDHNKERLAALKVLFYSQLLKFYTHNIHTTHQILLSFFSNFCLFLYSFTSGL